jgi:hypothetical protein
LAEDDVEPVDVTLMNPAVVEFQRPGVEVWLERVVGEGQVRKYVVAHSPLLSSKNSTISKFPIACMAGMDRVEIDARNRE